MILVPNMIIHYYIVDIVTTYEGINKYLRNNMIINLQRSNRSCVCVMVWCKCVRPLGWSAINPL